VVRDVKARVTRYTSHLRSCGTAHLYGPRIAGPLTANNQTEHNTHPERSYPSFAPASRHVLLFFRLCLVDTAVRRPNFYVQPRSRKIRSKIGMGIPRSQSKMYPVAPVCLILLVKRMFFLMLIEFFVCAETCFY
jgi:hypothetical protein